MTKIDSPRSKFIAGCLSKQLNPRASLLIRKDLTHEFQLAGMGMGDKMAVEFANSIQSVPVVHRINIEDNNLTDKGIDESLNSFLFFLRIGIVRIKSNFGEHYHSSQSLGVEFVQ